MLYAPGPPDAQGAQGASGCNLLFFLMEATCRNLLLLPACVQATRHRLCFSPDQIRILNDRQPNDLSDGESILILFLCTSLNALAPMTKQLDTLTTKLATVQSIMASLHTASALDNKHSPINTSLRDLSQRVNTTPHDPSAPSQPTIPPPGVVTRQEALPPVPRPRAPPRTSLAIIRVSTRTCPTTIRSGVSSTGPPRRCRQAP